MMSVRRAALSLMTSRSAATGAACGRGEGLAIGAADVVSSFGSRNVSSRPLRLSSTRSAYTECKVAPSALSIVWPTAYALSSPRLPEMIAPPSVSASFARIPFSVRLRVVSGASMTGVTTCAGCSAASPNKCEFVSTL
jgi:hypothetical protein